MDENRHAGIVVPDTLARDKARTADLAWSIAEFDEGGASGGVGLDAKRVQAACAAAGFCD